MFSRGETYPHKRKKESESQWDRDLSSAKALLNNSGSTCCRVKQTFWVRRKQTRIALSLTGERTKTQKVINNWGLCRASPISSLCPTIGTYNPSGCVCTAILSLDWPGILTFFFAVRLSFCQISSSNRNNGGRVGGDHNSTMRKKPGIRFDKLFYSQTNLMAAAVD